MRCKKCGEDYSTCPKCGEKHDAKDEGYSPVESLMKKLTQPAVQRLVEDPPSE